jgi:hypothetical protein
MSAGGTVKGTPVLDTPPTVTTTGPVVAPDGTGVVMPDALQFVGAAPVPLNETVLEPLIAPKPDPLIVIEVPGAPEVGDKLLITGVTAKVTLLLAVPPTLTTTGPDVALVGTVATTLF